MKGIVAVDNLFQSARTGKDIPQQVRDHYEAVKLPTEDEQLDEIFYKSTEDLSPRNSKKKWKLDSSFGKKIAN